MQEERIKMQ